MFYKWSYFVLTVAISLAAVAVAVIQLVSVSESTSGYEANARFVVGIGLLLGAFVWAGLAAAAYKLTKEKRL